MYYNPVKNTQNCLDPVNLSPTGRETKHYLAVKKTRKQNVEIPKFSDVFQKNKPVLPHRQQVL